MGVEKSGVILTQILNMFTSEILLLLILPKKSNIEGYICGEC
jgi:hypothetical protein